jgi:hypothetical protein
MARAYGMDLRERVVAAVDLAPVVGVDGVIDLVVQPDPDPGGPIDEAVPFGLAVTLSMPGVVEI